ncbi:MAG: translation initiation factor [Bacteroidales bacterium]|nr:translation initiation factor [Bacteroidales bacterium]
MANDWKDRLGVVFSTDPDFKYVTTADLEEEADTLPAASQKLTVSIDRRSRGGKQVTIVKGFVGTTADLESLGRTLKTRCGVGGSVKEGEILVQGDFRDRIVSLLQDMGYIKAKRGN